MSDPISRDDAIKAFEEEKQKAKEIRDDFSKFPNSVFEQSIYNEAVKAWRTAIYIVKNLPTIEERKGKWIKDEEESSYQVEPIFICSSCNNYKAWGWEECTPYCPYCGAKMEEDDEED